MLLDIIKLQAENRRLKKEIKKLDEELSQKLEIIGYLNGCVNKANRRYLDLVNMVVRPVPFKDLDFPNSSVESEGQISIHDILEN